jgi:hypothetical protein
MALSRKIIRAKLAELLAVTCTQASHVLAYQPSKIEATPGVYVRSMSSDRPPLTVRGKFTRFAFDILILVVHADRTAAPPWTEDKAEDLMDDLEASVCAMLSESRVVDGYWNNLDYSAPSNVEHFTEDGIAYLLELVHVTAEVQRDA